MTKFSANLGFLWSDHSLPDAIRAAKVAGFDAVECHWPYETSATDVDQALQETGLAMLGLNTSRGDLSAGENGVCALPGRSEDARAAIDQALTYATQIGTPNIHVMGGFAEGLDAHDTFVANLKYACAKANENGQSILIEPLNKYDAPGYFLQTTDQAKAIIEQVGASNLKLMFDCYHVQLMEGDLTHRIDNLMPIIGHIQFASVPDRGPPDAGEVNYAHIFQHLQSLGYTAPLGAEYKPKGPTDESLNWMAKLR
ncbi:MAG: TIM barrel protein [Pseudomonadota bacterium]